MSARLPLLILDEIMLPGTSGEVGLDPREAAFLAGRGADEREIPVLVACRVPGQPAPTQLEQKAAGHPGDLLEGALLGEGLIAPGDADDPSPRLVLAETRRVRLAHIASAGAGWEAAAAPWPLAHSDVASDEVHALAQRFYRALIVSRAPGEGDLRTQLEGPIGEIEAASADPVAGLLLLADYLYDSPESRQAALNAADAGELRDLVTDAIELLDAGLPGGPRAIGATVQAYLQEASGDGLGSVASAARVLRAVAPLVSGAPALLAEAAAVATELEAAQERFDQFAEQLLKAAQRAGKGKAQGQGQGKGKGKGT